MSFGFLANDVNYTPTEGGWFFLSRHYLSDTVYPYTDAQTITINPPSNCTVKVVTWGWAFNITNSGNVYTFTPLTYPSRSPWTGAITYEYRRYSNVVVVFFYKLNNTAIDWGLSVISDDGTLSVSSSTDRYLFYVGSVDVPQAPPVTVSYGSKYNSYGYAWSFTYQLPAAWPKTNIMAALEPPVAPTNTGVGLMTFQQGAGIELTESGGIFTLTVRKAPNTPACRVHFFAQKTFGAPSGNGLAIYNSAGIPIFVSTEKPYIVTESRSFSYADYYTQSGYADYDYYSDGESETYTTCLTTAPVTVLQQSVAPYAHLVMAAGAMYRRYAARAWVSFGPGGGPSQASGVEMGFWQDASTGELKCGPMLYHYDLQTHTPDLAFSAPQTTAASGTSQTMRLGAMAFNADNQQYSTSARGNMTVLLSTTAVMGG